MVEVLLASTASSPIIPSTSPSTAASTWDSRPRLRPLTSTPLTLCHAEGRRDGGEHLAHLDAVDATALSWQLRPGGGPFTCQNCQRSLVDVLHHCRDAAAGRLVGDATHDAGTQHGGMAGGLVCLLGGSLASALMC